jgi:hypothetical protein
MGLIPGLPTEMSVEQKIVFLKKSINLVMDRYEEILAWSQELEETVEDLKARIDVLEQRGRAGRKPKPLLSKDAGTCGIDPDSDDKTCASASVYRYQQGCRGAACVDVNQTYYAQYREKRKG